MLNRAFLAAATVLALLPAAASAAEPPCPLAENALIMQVAGSPVRGGVMTDPLNPEVPLDNGPDKTVCMWDSDDGNTIMVTRQTNAFGSGGYSGPADLAVKSSRLPAEARQEIEALREAGVANIRVPNLQITSASGIGDAAVWIFQTIQPYEINSGGFVVQRGADALVFGVIGPDEPAARTQAAALAQAVLASLPQ
jgi:hypothetical protein